MYWNEIHRDNRYCLNTAHKAVQSFIEEARYDLDVHNREPHILESGVGTGRNVKHALCVFGEKGTITATDICTEVVEKLVEEQIHAVVRDMRDSPVGSDTITHAISWRALHCLDAKGREETLDEKRRVLQPHANLLLAVRSQADSYFGLGDSTEPGTFTVVIQKHMPFGHIFHGEYDPHPWHFYSSEELYHELEQHGFSVQAISQCAELPGSFKYSSLQHRYWVVKAERNRQNLLWTGVSLIK